MLKNIKNNKCEVIIMANLIVSSTVFDHQTVESPEGLIAAYVKSTIAGQTDEKMKDMVEKYFVIMKLMNDNGTWNSGLSKIGDKLLPKNLSVKDFEGLVDEMAKNASENPYVHAFLTEAQGENFSELFGKIKKEGKDFIPGFVAYAMTLQNLTVEMRKDYKIAKVCEGIWREKCAEVGGAFKNIGFSGFVKYYSVKLSVSRMIAAFRKKKIDPQFGRFILPVNIVEATIYDMGAGNNDNMKAGWIAAMHRPGGASNEATGAGGTVITEDKNGISVKMPFPKDWADCYHAWNMAFVSQFDQFPYSMAKLLIPKVSGYQSNPSEYIHIRALALFAHLNFILHRPDEGLGGSKSFNWSCLKMTRLFGKVNRRRAEEYRKKVDTVNPSLLACTMIRIRNKIVNYVTSIHSFFNRISISTALDPLLTN